MTNKTLWLTASVEWVITQRQQGSSFVCCVSAGRSEKLLYGLQEK